MKCSTGVVRVYSGVNNDVSDRIQFVVATFNVSDFIFILLHQDSYSRYPH